MKRKLIFYTLFNTFKSNKLLRGAGKIHPVETEAWTRARIQIWQKFTLASILNQSRDDLLYVLLLEPSLRTLTDPLLPKLPDSRIIYSYDDSPVIEDLKTYDELVMALIDSDDMYSRSAGELMMASQAKWMYFKIGWAYEFRSNKLWGYDTKGTGPFYAQRLAGKDLTGFNRSKRRPYHQDVLSLHPQKLPDYNFCVGLHGTNTSSSPRISYVVKRPFDTSILKKTFGVKI